VAARACCKKQLDGGVIAMARKQRDPELDDMRLFMPKRYWLHVDQNGREFAFDKEPDREQCPTLCVDRFSTFEVTYTYNIFFDDRLVRVQPRGVGWKLENDIEPGSTVWWREVV
jgi:hypothetical protein